MTEKENLLHYMRLEPYDHVPEGLAFMDVGESLEHPILDGMGMLGCPLFVGMDPPVCERPMFGDGYDLFGVHWSRTAGVSHYTPGQKPRYEDIENWRGELRLPDVSKLDWDTFRREADKLDTENRVVTMTLLCGIFERATMITSMDNCLMDCISDPEDFSDMLGAIADYKIALIDRMSKYIHIDILTYHDDWGTAKSTFMSPALWRQTVKPHTRRIYDCMKRNGILICQHSCGCVAPLIPDMIEMGADMWDAQYSTNDLAAISRAYGDKLRISANKIGIADEPPAPGGPDRDGPGGPPPFTNLYPAYPEVPEFLFLN